MIVILICYFIIALHVFALLDFLTVKEIIPTIEVEGLVFLSIFWICLLVALIIAMPFWAIHKLIKRNNKV